MMPFPCGKLMQPMVTFRPVSADENQAIKHNMNLVFFEPRLPCRLLPRKKGPVVSVIHGCFCSGPVGYTSLVTESVGGNQFMYIMYHKCTPCIVQIGKVYLW